MRAFRFDLSAYLARIGLVTRPSTDELGLQELQRAQFRSIPFENLDIHLGRGIDLGPEHLFEKLVRGRRGGYCFELNGLMLMALESLGFHARPLLARVHLESPPSGRTHQLNLVDIQARPWIIDVGFGAGGLRRALPLELDRVAEGPGWAFRLREQPPWGIMMQSRIDDVWMDSYSFDLSHVTAQDIEVGNHFTSTSPTTHFTRSRVVSIPLDRGRISLLDLVLTQPDGQTRIVEPGASYLNLLAQTFGIELDAKYENFQAPAFRA